MWGYFNTFPHRKTKSLNHVTPQDLKYKKTKFTEDDVKLSR